MSNFELKNPLYAVTIGSHIKAGENSFETSPIDANISAMISQVETQKSMSGTSSYVYSERMNQGSFGLSGSYGVSGISKFKSSVSAYVGNAAANSSKSVEVNYNAISVCGVEYIDLEKLTVTDFMSSLNLGCQQAALKALDSYNAVNTECEKLGITLYEALTSDKEKYPTIHTLLEKWIVASNCFVHHYGDGMVVGITWGAFGGVKMLMTATSHDESWKYGGQADFSYAGVGESVTVKATYDGSQSQGNAEVDVDSTSYVSGEALSNQIDEWLKEIPGQSLKELANVKVMDKAPNMTITSGAPTIPEFEKPKTNETVASKIGQIENIEGLETYAKAKAYDEAKKDNPDLTLEGFLQQANQPANIEGLKEAEKNIEQNDINALTNIDLFKDEKKHIVEEKLVQSVAMQKMAAADTKGDYVPLGVWVSNWSDLLPWLAQGYYNSIDNIDTNSTIQTRVMLQDFQSLSRLYYIANASGVIQIKRKDLSQPAITTLDLALNFANLATEIQACNGTQEALENICGSLGDEAKLIYKYWNDNTFLRNAELGLGFLSHKRTIDSMKDEGDDSRKVYTLKSCSFTKSNYTAFSQSYKVLPLLTPDQEIWAFGPEAGILSSAYETEAVFSKPSRVKFISFIPDKKNGTLNSDDGHIVLYPIPFNAAKGIEWKGMSSSTNIGADQDLKDSLNKLQRGLEKLNAWTYSSQNWPIDWNTDSAYQQKSVKKQYLGLIDEIPNIF
jgi:hypothetical protein